MVNTMPIAQGAGTVAAIAAAKGQDVADTDIRELREALFADGAVLELQ